MVALNEVQDERIKSNKERLDKIETHIGNTNREMGEIRDILTKVVNDVSWLKRFFFIVATASIGSLIATLLSVLK